MINCKDKMRKWDIYYNGNKVGTSYGISAAQARQRYWWRVDKDYDEFSERLISPCDYDVLDIATNTFIPSQYI